MILSEQSLTLGIDGQKYFTIWHFDYSSKLISGEFEKAKE